VAAHLQAGQWNTKDRLRLALALNMHLDQMSTALEQVASLIGQVPVPDEREEGREEEEERRKTVAIARKLLARGESVEKDADLTGLPRADVQKLQTR